MRRLLKTVLPFGVVLFLAVVATALWSVHILENAIRIEKDAIIVQGIVGDLSQQLQIAESSQRNYLLTGNDIYLRAYTQAIPKLPGILKRLRRVTSGEPKEEKIVSEIDRLVSKKLEEIKLTVILRKASKNEEAIAITNPDQGQQLMIEIYGLLNQLDHKAEVEATRHEGFVQRYSTLLKVSIAVGSLISIALVLIFAKLSRNEIRQRRQNEESLQRAEQAALIASSMKSRFLSTISHEIRTPLNGIIGMSDLLRDRIQDAEGQKYSKIIHQSSLGLLRIVNDLLDLSKIEAGKVEFELSPLSCRNLVETAAELYSVRAREKGLSLVTSIDAAIPDTLIGDSSRIIQVLRNLIANAVKFTFNGSVKIEVRPQLEVGSIQYVKFEIHDSGIGVPENMRQYLFEPFHQLHNRSSGGSEGTGLGLSICKGLIEQMDGKIGYSALPSGSLFWFEIPLKIQQRGELANAAMSPELVRPTIEPEDGLVLLVEDNQTNLLVAESYLEKRGLKVHSVENGNDALVAIETNSYQIIFMDCQMPLMDGFETAKKIRQRERQLGNYTPIIAMTADVMPQNRESCFAAGMDGFLPKPIQPIELDKVLQQWLPSSTAEAVNWTALKKLANDTNSDVVRQLISSYRTTLTQAVGKIEAAFESADIDGIRRAAHNLRASSATLGAMKLSQLCLTLESKTERTLLQEKMDPEDLNPDVDALLSEAENIGRIFAEQKIFC